MRWLVTLSKLCTVQLRPLPYWTSMCLIAMACLDNSFVGTAWNWTMTCKSQKQWYLIHSALVSAKPKSFKIMILSFILLHMIHQIYAISIRETIHSKLMKPENLRLTSDEGDRVIDVKIFINQLFFSGYILESCWQMWAT